MTANRFLLLALVTAYFFVPLLAQLSLDPEFYVYSPRQLDAGWITGISGAVLALFVVLATRRGRFQQAQEFPVERLKPFLYLALVYALFLAAHGLRLRAAGWGRIELLEEQSNFLLPGVGFVLMLAGVYAIATPGRKPILLIVGAFFSIDYAYMGKIYTYMAAAIVVSRWDYRGRPFGLVTGVLMLLGGSGFLVLTYLVRAASANSELDFLFDLYTIFSEFVGVQASVGWAMDYVAAGRSPVWLNFSSDLRDYYVGSVGHGLALSPAAYFYSHFGSLWLVALATFLLILQLTLRLGLFYCGPVFLFLLPNNFQHLMRHGPDIFLSKFVAQSLVLIIVIAVARNFDLLRVPRQVEG